MENARITVKVPDEGELAGSPGDGGHRVVIMEKRIQLDQGSKPFVHDAKEPALPDGVRSVIHLLPQKCAHYQSTRQMRRTAGAEKLYLQL